jgi:hypothetical protein
LKYFLSFLSLFFVFLGSGFLNGCASSAIASSADSRIEAQLGSSAQEQAEWRQRPNDLRQAAGRLEIAYSAFRSTGLVEQKNKEQTAPIDDQENAVAYLLSATQKLRAIELGRAKKVNVMAGLPGVVQTTEDPILEDYGNRESQSVFALLTVALSKPRANFRSDENRWGSTAYIQFSDLRKLVELECAKAEAEARENRAADCAAALNEAWKLSWVVAKDRSILGDLIACQGAKTVLLTLEECISHFDPLSSHASQPDSRFEDFRRNLALNYENPLFRENCESSVADAVLTTSKLDGTSSGLDLVSASPHFPTSLEGRAYLTRILEFWTSQAGNVKDLNLHPKAAGYRIDNAATSLHSTLRRSDRVLDEMEMVYGPVGQEIDEVERLRTAERYILATFSYRHATGRWPYSLASLQLKDIGRSSDYQLVVTQGFVQVSYVKSAGGFRGLQVFRSRERRAKDPVIVASCPPLPFSDGRNLRGVPVAGEQVAVIGGPPNSAPKPPTYFPAATNQEPDRD